MIEVSENVKMHQYIFIIPPQSTWAPFARLPPQTPTDFEGASQDVRPPGPQMSRYAPGRRDS